MSTEHQKYSTANQSDAIRKYAERHGMEVVRTYEDAGKSGLNIEGRKGLRQLIADVQGGDPGFESILVYDISRWGRFQDADESAYYEYVCRRNGVSIHYCAEQFENDGSPISTIVKGVKRAMAGEYSRELSAKVFAGQCRLVELGYRQAGAAGYGLRRMLIDQDGNYKGILAFGERKNLFTDRVILVPGPKEERDLVNRIYRLFVNEGKGETGIARLLNSEGVATDRGGRWTRAIVHEVLTNEKYIGNNVYHRTSIKLRQRRINNPRDMWIRKNAAFEPIVDDHVFYEAQRIIRERADGIPDEEVLDQLKALYRQHGYLSRSLINESELAVNSKVCRYRFGGLRKAYELVGFRPDRDFRYIEINRRLRRYRPLLVGETVSALEAAGAVVAQDPATDILSVNGEFTFSIVIARHDRSRWAGTPRWIVRFDTDLRPDITVAARMDSANERALDYYLLPRVDFSRPSIRLAGENGATLDTYRFDTLDFLFCMAERVRLKEIA